jgi:hypothetical protein
MKHSAEFAERDVTVIPRDPDVQIREPDVQIDCPGVHSCEPIIGKLRTGNSESPVLRTASLSSDASFQRIYQSIFGQKESKEALQQGASGKPIARPYTASDIECLYDALANVDRMTFDGIIACSRNPSSWEATGSNPPRFGPC